MSQFPLLPLPPPPSASEMFSWFVVAWMGLALIAVATWVALRWDRGSREKQGAEIEEQFGGTD